MCERSISVRNIKKRWILFILFLSIISCGLFSKKSRQVYADDTTSTEEISPYHKPTGDVKKFLGIWLTSGYSLQPNETNYVEVNDTVTLHTDQARSFLTAAATLAYSPHYQWYESSDGKKWSEVSSKNGGNRKHFPVTPDTVGTKYYQQRTAWYILIYKPLIDPTVYSKVATVHALPEPVNATDLKVSVDDDYLYNSSNDVVSTTTYAHANVTPDNFTGKISWSIDNTNLATIDSETGLIEANKSRRAGVVTVTATLTNPDGSVIKAHEKVTIGGGLEDQTVDAGEKATFDLRGNVGELDESDSNYTVKWYKEDPITGYRTKLDVDDKALSITTDNTTLDDDGTLFLAIIQVKLGLTNLSYTTNDAFLYVRPKGGPDLSVDNTLVNDTYNDGSNTNTMLFGVNNDDEVTYKNTLTNNSDTGTLSDASYVLPLKTGTKVNSVKVDGTQIDSSEYKVSKNDKTGNTDLTIPDLSFKNKESHDVEVNTTVKGITEKGSYDFIPYITGKTDDGSDYQKIGSQEVLNFTTNKIEYKISDVDYGNLEAISKTNKIYRKDEQNMPNNIIDIDDMRRVKTPMKLNLTQISDFKNENGLSTLSSHLRFYENGGYTNLSSDSATIMQTKTDEELSSIGWDKENGILLYVDNKFNAPGKYTATLNWSFEDSI